MKKNMMGMRYIIQRIIFIDCSCSGDMTAFCCCFIEIHVLAICMTQKSTQKMLRWSPMSQMSLPQRMTSS